MPHIKLDTGFYRHPKTAALLAMPKGADLVVALQQLWCWAGESESPQAAEGQVPDAVLRLLGVTPKQAQRLAEVGFLERNGSGWVINDWKEWQEGLIDMREQRTAQRRQWREQKQRQRRRGQPDGPADTT